MPIDQKFLSTGEEEIEGKVYALIYEQQNKHNAEGVLSGCFIVIVECQPGLISFVFTSSLNTTTSTCSISLSLSLPLTFLVLLDPY